MSNIACPKCGAALSGSAVSVTTLVARCDACDHVFRFEDQLAPPRPDSALVVSLKPERFDVKGGEVVPSEEATYRTAAALDAKALVVRWRWFTPQAFVTLAFAIAWDAFLVFWYGLAFTKGGPLIMFVIPLAHVAVGVAITYGALSRLLNSTTITVDTKELRCVTTPVPNPFRANVVIPLDALVELEVNEKKVKGSTTYDVVARDDGGRTYNLGAFDMRREADYLAVAIQRQVVRLDRVAPRLLAMGRVLDD